MMQLARLVIIGFLLLSVVYLGVSLWSRSVRAAKLRKEWEDSGRPGDKETFVQVGLEDYDGSIRRKLILLVYIVPVVVVGTIIYMTNFM